MAGSDITLASSDCRLSFCFLPGVTAPAVACCRVLQDRNVCVVTSFISQQTEDILKLRTVSSRLEQIRHHWTKPRDEKFGTRHGRQSISYVLIMFRRGSLRTPRNVSTRKNNSSLTQTTFDGKNGETQVFESSVARNSNQVARPRGARGKKCKMNALHYHGQSTSNPTRM